MSAWIKPIYDLSVSDIFISDSPSDISEPDTSIPSLKKFLVSSLKLPPKTSHFSLAFDVPSEIPFPIQLDISNSDSEDDIQDDIHPITFIDSFPQPFHDQKTQQPSGSTVGKSQNCLDSALCHLCMFILCHVCISLVG